jgi:hypothetical protein
MEDIARRIEDEVTSWEGATSRPHRFGGVEFRLGRRELGHLHGDRLADLPYPKRIAAMLVETGRAEPHRFASGGWVSKPIRGPEDVDDVVELFRLSYERARVAAEVAARRRS